MLDLISEAKEKAVLRLEYFGLEEEEVEFVKLLKEGKEKEINGKFIHQVLKRLKIKRVFELKEPSPGDYQKMWKKQKDVFEEYTRKFNKAVESLTIKTPFESKILEDSTQEYELKKFFNEDVREINLLFRAS